MMIKYFKLLFPSLLGLCLIFNNSAHAQDDDLFASTSYGSFHHFDHVPYALFFFGDIQRNDSFEFRKAMRNHPIEIVVLGSAGGSVWEGLSIAGIIHDKELDTYISKESDCASACSYMFFAGQPRYSGGKLGVHQFYTGNKKVEENKTNYRAQFTTSEIIGFLNEFKTPPFVFERMFAQKEMYYFNNNEIETINTYSRDDAAKNKRHQEIDDFLTKFSAKFKAEKEQKVATNPKDIIRGVQSALNNVGCKLGGADGVVGPASIRALQRFTKKAGIRYDKNLFTSVEFLAMVKEKPSGYCPPVVYKPKFARNWIFKPNCKAGINKHTKFTWLNAIASKINETTYVMDFGITIFITGKRLKILAIDNSIADNNGKISADYRHIRYFNNNSKCTIEMRAR